MRSLLRSHADETGVNCHCFESEIRVWEVRVYVGCWADMFWRLNLVLLAAAFSLSLPRANAQMRGMHAYIGHNSAGRTGRIHASHRLPRKLFPGYVYPDLSGGYYSDVQYDQQYTEETTSPQVLITQSTAVEYSPQKIKSGPLLIELQGDRYVRFGGAETDRSGTSVHPDYAESTTAKPIREVFSAQKEHTEAPSGKTTPVVLVYRNGHREEISDYAIANGMIYAHGTYWQDGYWTKQIPLSALDPQATLQANQERGVKFMLPSAPNVVIASF